jgi:HK97 family phage major capsid protein
MDELKKLIEGMNRAFNDFKDANETRIKAIESKGYAPADLVETVQKLATAHAATEALVDEKVKQMEVMERAIALNGAPGGGDANTPKPVYNTLGDQLADVIAAANPDLSNSRKAEAISRLAQVRAAASGANEAIPSEGGFLVQKDFGGTLNQNAIATGILASRCNKIPISATANGYKANVLDETSRANGSRFGGIQVYHAAEAATVTATKPKWRAFEMGLHKLFGLMYATDELLQDTQALAATVGMWFPMEFGFKLDDVIIRGSGVGQGLGALNSPALVTVPKESGQKADTILFENIVNMDARLLDSSENSALWLCNRDIKPSLATMSLAIGTGGVPVYLPANAAFGRPQQQLYGRNMMTMEQCSTLGDVGDIMLFDPAEYMMISKGGIQSAVSIHVQFIYDEQTFRWTYRYDGSPIRNKPITPYQGSKTRSPFLALAARA